MTGVIHNPKISIITVCFNSEVHVEEAILSAINQSYPNKEYVIIDGGSIDGTHSIIDKYKDQIEYFVSEPDRGISDAFNKGIMAIASDIISIINSEDKLSDGALQVVANNFFSDYQIMIFIGALVEYRVPSSVLYFILHFMAFCKNTLCYAVEL